MRHNMKLDSVPFDKIRKGKKTIELRLYDEKRRIIEVGDEIEFTNRKNRKESFLTEVINLHMFDSFEELYVHLPLEKCGYEGRSIATASPDDMLAYYSREQQEKYGVVGIEVKVMNHGENTLTSLSRYLSMILRHKPEAAGITLDSHGWADVDALLQGIGKTREIDREILEKIVAEDSKGRYAFNENHTKIRANQGHSVKVDVELAEVVPPEFLYHGTVEKNDASIGQNGLIAKERLYVHLSVDERSAAAVGLRRGIPIVYRVDALKMYEDGYRFYLSQNGVYLTSYVPAVYLTGIE